jgi:hypothetical protein
MKHEGFSNIEGLGKSIRSDSCDLQSDREISKAGTLRCHQPDPTCSGFHSHHIAEGCGKDGDAELGRYFKIAMGSSSELEYLLLLSRDL